MLKASSEIDLSEAGLKNQDHGLCIDCSTYKKGLCHQSVPEDRRMFISALGSSAEKGQIHMIMYNYDYP